MGNEDVDFVTIIKPEDKRPLREKYNIRIDNLSFEYITECQNAREIEKMVLILRSGEEGYFPDLTKHAERRLAELQPNSYVLRVCQPILKATMLNKNEREHLNHDMNQWMEQMHLREKDLEDDRALNINDAIPQPKIRKVIDKSSKSSYNNRPHKPGRIKSCDYAAWDKYDVDTEITRIDLKAEQEQAAVKRFQQKQKAKKIAEQSAINKLTLTGTGISVIAEKEREKGNEAFKAGDYEEALQQYSLSLSIDSTINGYNNRAITYIKLKNYQEAVQDCNKVLGMDYMNVKAMLRRALALENLGNKEEALEDYSAALKVEPNNKTAMLGVKKLSNYCDSKKVRMKIEELSDDESKKRLSSDEIIKEPPKLKIEEIKMDSQRKKPANKAKREVTFADEPKIGKNSEICFCDRAPCSSQYSKPLPHKKTEYCYDLEKNEVKRSSQSIFTFSNTDFGSSKSSGVVIEEIPNEPEIKFIEKLSKKGKDLKISETSTDAPASACEEFDISISSPYEFLCTWQSLRGHSDLKLHAQLLKCLGPRNLQSIIGSKLDGHMFSIMLKSLEQHCCREEDAFFVRDFLDSLRQLNRFSIVSMFMDSSDKKVARTIIEFLEQQKLTGTDMFRKYYNLSS